MYLRAWTCFWYPCATIQTNLFKVKSVDFTVGFIITQKLLNLIFVWQNSNSEIWNTVYYWHFVSVSPASHWGIILLFLLDTSCVLWALVMTETPASASSVCHLWMTSSPFSTPVFLYPQSVIACSHPSVSYPLWQWRFLCLVSVLNTGSMEKRKPIRCRCGWSLEYSQYLKKR